jgi:purine nucleosidase
MTMRRPIIIDTDPGQDDAIAILLALAAPAELDVRAIVAVAGNVPLESTERNARQICELAGRGDIPVYRGCAAPLKRPLVTAPHIHGDTGLAGPALQPPAMPSRDGGVDYLIEALSTCGPRGLTVCTLGPLTNLATALARKPEIAGAIAELVMMGGAHFAGGNVTPVAEFNIHVDPEAADIVLRALSLAEIPVTMLPLDLTHTVLSTPARIASLRAIDTACARAVVQILEATGYNFAKYRRLGAPLHDPCVIAYLLAPALFTGRHVNVEVETTSALTLGATVVDWWSVTARTPNVMFMNQVDADGVYRLLAQRLARLP